MLPSQAEHMDYDKTIARIYEHLEEDHVEKAVMACLRVARATEDYLNAAIFLRELYPKKEEVARALADDLRQLDREARKLIAKLSLERWLDLHTLDFSLTPGEDDDDDLDPGDRHKVGMFAAGELDSRLAQWEGTIEDLSVPPGMGPFDTAAFADRLMREKAAARVQITAIQMIKSRLKTRCLNYAIQIERQLDAQRKSQSFLEGVQNDVNNFFKARSEDVFNKLLKAAQLATSSDLEDSALLLTEVRRALKAAADYFYPPVERKVVCADGVERALGNEQYLNRLHQYLAERVVASTSKEMLEAELDHLSSFFRRLNDMASKGVHTNVTLAEAKQGLVGLYFLLFNISRHVTIETLAQPKASE
jgi:hypothetical protein